MTLNGWAPPRPDVKYATKTELEHDLVADRKLSGGLTVRVRRGTMAQFLIEDGELPNPLRALATGIESGAHNKQRSEAPETLTESDVKDYETLVWRFISHYLEEPKVTFSEVPRLFSPKDRENLFTFIIHGDMMEEIARFRREIELLKLEGADDGGSAGES